MQAKKTGGSVGSGGNGGGGGSGVYGGERRIEEVPKWTDDACGWWSLVFIIFVCSASGLYFVIPGIASLPVKVFLSMGVSVCVILSLLFLVIVEKVDPGVVPPNTTQDPLIALAEVGTIAPDLVQDERGQWVRRRFSPEGQTESVERYCNTCHIWRQPRTSHCSKCGYCMERFDHHCGAVGTCIARKNHRFFVAFLFFASLGAMMLLVACILRLREDNWGQHPGATAWENWRTIVLGILAFIYFYITFLFFFAILHCAILVCDFTTKQYIKSRRGGTSVRWPTFSEWLQNLKAVCCAEVRSKYSTAVYRRDNGKNGKKPTPSISGAGEITSPV